MHSIPVYMFILLYALDPSFYVLCLFDVYFYVDHCACNFFLHVIFLLLSCIVLHERCYTNKVYYHYYYYHSRDC